MSYNASQSNDKSFKRYLLLGIALIALLTAVYPSGPGSNTAVERQAVLSAGFEPTFIMSPSKPERLLIPVLGINAGFEELGLNSDQTIEVPKRGANAGWYRLSKTPGELGPAVLIGHLDWYQGPGVFANLDKLAAGDLVKIKRADGTVAVFEVKLKEKYPQHSFETEKVYGKIDHAGLRLITCTGDFLKQEGHYTDNLVVYADLVSSE